jgi:hypothetical protein
MINISNSDIYYKPYPYMLFKDVFDVNFYNLLCSEFPKTNELLKLDFDKKKNEYKQDKYFLTNLNKGFFQLINKKKNTKYLYEFLKSPLFLNQLINFLNNNNLRIKYNLNSGIASKFKKLIFKKTDFTFEFSSMSSKNGFIYPHTDGPDKILTLIVPIISDPRIKNVKNVGTNILESLEDKYEYNFMNYAVPFESTKSVKEIPFSENQILMFIKTHNSLHSVGPMIDMDNNNLMRNSINFCIYNQN